MASRDPTRYGPAALAWSLLVAALLTVPGGSLPSVGMTWVDKPVHAVLFAIHSLLLARALLPGRSPSRAVAVAALLSGLYAGVLEAVQILVPGRGWDWWDLAAGLGGIALAAVFVVRRRASLSGAS